MLWSGIGGSQGRFVFSSIRHCQTLSQRPLPPPACGISVASRPHECLFLSTFYFSHTNGHEVVSSLNVFLMIFFMCFWPFRYLPLWRSVCSRLPIFSIGSLALSFQGSLYSRYESFVRLIYCKYHLSSVTCLCTFLISLMIRKSWLQLNSICQSFG